MKRVFQQIMSILLAFTLLFAVSGHQLLYHICNHHGIHNVTFSFFVKEAVNHCTCFGCHHHEEMCSEEHHACCEHHHDCEDIAFQDEESCCDVVSKLLKITNPFQSESKVQLPMIAVLDFGTIFAEISLSEIIKPLQGNTWESPPNWIFSEFFNKSFLFTQFLF